MRHFEIYNVASYEAARLQLDAARGLPLGETTYAMASVAQRSAAGSLLLAIRDEHADLPDMASAVAQMDANGWGREITGFQYEAVLVTPQPLV